MNQIHSSFRFCQEPGVVVLKAWHGLECPSDVQDRRFWEKPVAKGAAPNGGEEEVHSLYRQRLVTLASLGIAWKGVIIWMRCICTTAK